MVRVSKEGVGETWLICTASAQKLSTVSMTLAMSLFWDPQFKLCLEDEGLCSSELTGQFSNIISNKVWSSNLFLQLNTSPPKSISNSKISNSDGRMAMGCHMWYLMMPDFKTEWEEIWQFKANISYTFSKLHTYIHVFILNVIS